MAILGFAMDKAVAVSLEWLWHCEVSHDIYIDLLLTSIQPSSRKFYPQGTSRVGENELANFRLM